MEPVFADFSTNPAQLSNAVVTHHRCGIASSHLALGAGGHIKVDFTVDGREENDEAVVTVTVLGTSAPMDVLLNGKTLAEQLAIPADGAYNDPQDVVLSAPGNSWPPVPTFWRYAARRARTHCCGCAPSP